MLCRALQAKGGAKYVAQRVAEVAGRACDEKTVRRDARACEPYTEWLRRFAVDGVLPPATDPRSTMPHEMPRWRFDAYSRIARAEAPGEHEAMPFRCICPTGQPVISLFPAVFRGLLCGLWEGNDGLPKNVRAWVAGALKASHATVDEWTSGATQPPAEQLARLIAALCDAHGCPGYVPLDSRMELYGKLASSSYPTTGEVGGQRGTGSLLVGRDGDAIVKCIVDHIATQGQEGRWRCTHSPKLLAAIVALELQRWQADPTKWGDALRGYEAAYWHWVRASWVHASM
jgi:hypothetical protein